ncbi:MAG TPA: methyltransferase domain-containing protein [Pseudonocardiaceae bacterium]|nr:methyltransferase domain-containing protein [Pseudonocardiaceae bacterium]
MSVFERTRPVDYLERLAASDLGRGYKSLAVTELGINRGDIVLDLGCGPGVDLPAFAAEVGPSGMVIGLDRDAALVEQAAASTAELSQVVVRECDIHAIDLPDASVDHVHTDRVLQHVADPAAVLAQARRVLRPGGSAVFVEPDWDTLIIDHPDVAVVRAYTRFVTDEVVRNEYIGRQLSGLAIAAGFAVTNVIPITTVFRDVRTADQVLGLGRVTDRAVTSGYLTASEGERFLAHLTTRPFFASATLFLIAVTAVLR